MQSKTVANKPKPPIAVASKSTIDQISMGKLVDILQKRSQREDVKRAAQSIFRTMGK